MTGTMHLRILLPTDVLVDRRVARIVAEGAAGWFGVLPRHADMATALAPGLLTFVDPDGVETVVAVDEGTFVKLGREVLVSVRRAARGDDLDHLRAIVDREFRRLDARERTARTALARLESGVVRRFLDFSRPGP